MAGLMEYIEELVEGVGPRLAGSDQEYRASEVIAERLEALGLATQTEEFDCYPFTPWIASIGYALVFFGGLFAFFIPGAVIAGLVMVVIGLAIVILEILGVNPLHRLLPTKLSQNVIARYVPTGSIVSERTRKVVILAHYDTGRSLLEALPFLARQLRILKIVLWVALAVVLVTTVLLLLPLPELIITVSRYALLAGVLVVAVALFGGLLDQFRPISRGANCNASGVGVLYTLAEQLTTQGALSSAAAAGSGPRRRRRSAAEPEVAAGANPDNRVRARRAGAESTPVVAEAASPVVTAAITAGGAYPQMEQLAAGAAVSQLPGDPASADPTALNVGNRGRELRNRRGGVEAFQGANAEDTLANENSAPRSVAENLVQVGTERENPFVTARAEGQGARNAAVIESEEPAVTSSEDSSPTANLPDWFVAARRKAEMKNEQRTHRDGEPEIVRSRFADVPTNSNAAPSAPTQLTTSDLSPIFEPVEPALAAADLPAEVDLSAAFELPPTGEQLALDGPVAAVSDAAVVTRPAGNRRSAALPDPDFSGLDRQAFRVVADQHQTAPLIIPLRGDSAGDSENTPALPVPTSISPMVPPTLASAAPAAAVPAAGVSTPVVPVAPAVPTAGSVATSFAAPTSASASPPTYAPPAASAPASQPIYAPSAPTYAPSAPTPAAPPTASAPASPPTSVPQAPSTPAPDPLVQVTNTTVSVAKTTVTLRHSDLSQRLAALPEVTPSLDSKTAGQQIALQSEPDIPTDQLFASADSLVSNTGAFIPLASTGVMKPVGEDLLAYHEDSGADLFVADADDSIQTSASHYTAGGTYSDPELMQIKETGLRSLLGRLGHGRREKRDLDDSPAEWLGVEEGYDARQAGESIGSWQNFSEDDDDQEPWQGGAFGGTSTENAQAMAELSQELLDKEVWLVALGSGDLGHSGVRNLLKRHDRQLKGSLYINVLGVGAGDLCFTILEGEIISTRTDQRLQNLLAAAAQELAVPLAPRVFTAFDTDASVVLHQTGRAISLIGMGDALPKYWRNKDDAVGQIREDKITATSDLILETIKNC